jgi:hypothetical protein
MDDRLPPAGAREIGIKISRSAFAAELLERIREVKRRRRVAAAAADTPSIDANLLAEYLDDQLSPELVQRIEQKILASDQLLAEVAAAHELLGLLHDPISLEPQLRDRLYALDPTGVEDVVRAAGNSTASTASAQATAWMPDLAPTNSRRNWSAAVIAGLALIWVISLAVDPRLFQDRRKPVNIASEQPAAVIAEQPEPQAAEEVPSPVEAAADKPAGEVSIAAAVSEGTSPTAGGPPTELISLSRISLSRISLSRTSPLLCRPQNYRPTCLPLPRQASSFRLKTAQCWWRTLRQSSGSVCRRFEAAMKCSRPRTQPTHVL